MFSRKGERMSFAFKAEEQRSSTSRHTAPREELQLRRCYGNKWPSCLHTPQKSDLCHSHSKQQISPFPVEPPLFRATEASPSHHHIQKYVFLAVVSERYLFRLLVKIILCSLYLVLKQFNQTILQRYMRSELNQKKDRGNTFWHQIHCFVWLSQACTKSSCVQTWLYSHRHTGVRRGAHTHYLQRCTSSPRHWKKKTLDFQNLACRLTADVCLTVS